MKYSLLIHALLAAGLVMSPASKAIAHVGHGDEFQAEGGIERVQVNPETDPMLGIVVTPIAAAADGSPSVMVPSTALVDNDGKPLVFVKYENFYEPVPVTTGQTKGDLIEITEGLSVGEELVTQGSLSLYAESRKTQTTSAAASPETAAAPAEDAHAQADAQGIPHQHDANGNLVAQASAAAPPAEGLPLKTMAAIGGTAALLIGAGVIAGSVLKKKKGNFSDGEGGF